MDHGLEQLAEQIALPKPAVPVLGEGRVVGHCGLQAQPAEPAIGQVEMYLFTEPALRTDAEAVADDEHPDHQFGIDRRAADLAVEGRKRRADAVELDEPVDRTE